MWTLIGVLTVAIGSILLVGQVEPAGFPDPEDGLSGPGRWLTLLATLVLGVAHAARAGELRR